MVSNNAEIECTYFTQKKMHRSGKLDQTCINMGRGGGDWRVDRPDVLGFCHPYNIIYYHLLKSDTFNAHQRPSLQLTQEVPETATTSNS